MSIKINNKFHLFFASLFMVGSIFAATADNLTEADIGVVEADETVSSSPATSSSSTIRAIKITGNQRIEQQTILSRLSVQVGDNFEDGTLDQIVKDLFRTGYFVDNPDAITVKRVGNAVHIHIRENSSINRVAFEGNSKLKDNVLKQEVQLRPRQVLSHGAVEAARQRILEIYRRMGRFSATVEPKIIKLPQNRVDLVFEINEGNITNVQKINFIGNKRFDHKTLEEQMLTKRKKWYRFFANDDTYDPDRFRADQHLLRQFYYDSGFPDFRIISAVAELSPDHKGFYLTFTLREGVRYKFAQTNIVSSIPGLQTAELRELISFKSGDWFSSKLIEKTVERITAAIGNKGFAFAQVEPKIKLNRESKTVKLDFEIKEGPRVYIERIEIVGNKRTRDHVIRRELQVHEGDAYNSSKVQTSEKRLMNLGYFKKVDIITQRGSAPDRTVLLIRLEEQSTGELNFGIGYSTTDKALITARYNEDNFMGKGQQIYADVRFAKKHQDFDVGFTEPYFMGRRLLASVSVFHTRNKRISAFDKLTKGFVLTLGYFLSDYWSQAIHYALRSDEIKGISNNASPTIRAQKGTKVTSAIGQTIAYDRRDNRFAPTEGYFFSMSNTFAGLGGSIRYLSNVFNGAFYHPITESVIFSIKGAIGVMLRLGKDIRVVDSYHLGATDFKGFEFAGLGPRDRVTKDPLGGTRYWKVTTQVTFPIGLPKEFGIKGAVHATAGSVWKVGRSKSTNPNIVDKNAFRASAGGGVTWDSPFGPISVDYTIPVKKQGFDKGQQFLISFSTRD